MKSIAAEIAELRALEFDGLVERYVALFGREPRVRNREYVYKRIAWRMQELRFGGLSGTAKKKLTELMAGIDLPKSESTRSVTGGLDMKAVTTGVVLTREWHGQRIDVRVTDEGFEHAGVVFRSLSAVAKHVTGAHWNGRAFFGLKERAG